MLDWLKQKIVDVIKWFADMFVAIFVAAWDILRDIFAWLFEQLLDIAIAAANSLDLSSLDNVTGWGELPSEIINIMGLLGIGTASSIILSAVVIRLVLQLIPFTRLGS